MDWKKYLKETNYAKDTDRILNAFRVGKILTYMDLQNAPVRLGAVVCGYSTYLLVAELNAAIAAEKAADVPPIDKAAAASVAAESTATKETEQPEKASTGKRSGGRSKQGATAEKADKA